MKRCPRCGETKNLTEFGRRNPGRPASHCKPCAREIAQEWRAANPDRVRANNRAWSERNYERKLELNRRCGYRHSPEYMKAWREKHRERLRAARIAAYDPTKQRIKNRLTWLRIRGGGSPDADYVAVLVADPCSYCGRPADQIDHIDPVAAGGTSDWDNLTAACGRCNSSKNSLPLLAWLAAR